MAPFLRVLESDPPSVTLRASLSRASTAAMVAVLCRPRPAPIPSLPESTSLPASFATPTFPHCLGPAMARMCFEIGERASCRTIAVHSIDCPQQTNPFSLPKSIQFSAILINSSSSSSHSLTGAPSRWCDDACRRRRSWSLPPRLSTLKSFPLEVIRLVLKVQNNPASFLPASFHTHIDLPFPLHCRLTWTSVIYLL